jgi:hypothetical protein
VTKRRGRRVIPAQGICETTARGGSAPPAEARSNRELPRAAFLLVRTVPVPLLASSAAVVVRIQ